METFDWFVAVALVIIIWNQAKIKQAIDYLQQDHLDFSQKMFPEDSTPDED